MAKCNQLTLLPFKGLISEQLLLTQTTVNPVCTAEQTDKTPNKCVIISQLTVARLVQNITVLLSMTFQDGAFMC